MIAKFALAAAVIIAAVGVAAPATADPTPSDPVLPFHNLTQQPDANCPVPVFVLCGGLVPDQLQAGLQQGQGWLAMHPDPAPN